MAIDVNADTFEQKVLKSSTPVLVDFWGPSCQPCLALAPQVEELENDYGGKFKLVKIDASKNRRLCLNMRVLGLPTFLIFKGGQEIDRLNGAGLTIDQIEKSVKKLVD